MCYYNGIKVSRDEYIRLKDLEKSLAGMEHLLRPLQNGFDFEDSIIIQPNADRTDFDLVPMEWGFLPPYIKTRAEATRMREGYMNAGKWVKYDTQNAKGEELLQPGKIYRDAALNRRCLVLSSGFYEWRHLPKTGKKGQPLKAVDKYPYRIFLQDKPYFFMAGIWQPWTDRETGEHVNTYSIVTTAANPLMKIIHNSKERMPTILPPSLAASWVFDELSEEQITAIATHQHPWQEMRGYTVSKTFREDVNPDEPIAMEQVPEIVIEGIRIA